MNSKQSKLTWHGQQMNAKLKYTLHSFPITIEKRSFKPQIVQRSQIEV
jgi:hypothetical protein